MNARIQHEQAAVQAILDADLEDLPPLPTCPAPLSEHEVLEQLRYMRGLLSGGWCQKAMFEGRRETVSYCLVGAMDVASNYLFNQRLRDDALRALDFHSDFHAVAWNDADSRQRSDVMERLDKAINTLEAKLSSDHQPPE